MRAGRLPLLGAMAAVLGLLATGALLAFSGGRVDLGLAGALLCAVLALALAAHAALRRAWERGPLARDAAVEAFAARLAEGRYDQLLPLPRALWRDDQLLALRATLRGVHEERARLQRLIGVLRAAETEPDRRDALDALRRAADGDDRFADGALAPFVPPPPPWRPLWPVSLAVAVLMVLAWALATRAGLA